MLASKVPLDADKLIMLLTIELSGGEGSCLDAQGACLEIP